MKKYCHILYIAVMMLLPALNLNAQSNEKPVWVIAHGANWKYSTDRALELGANGVEVDIRTKNTFWNLFYDNTEGKHWSLGHDTYHEYAECDKDNPRAVSLEWMLTGKVPGITQQRLMMMKDSAFSGSMSRMRSISRNWSSMFMTVLLMAQDIQLFTTYTIGISNLMFWYGLDRISGPMSILIGETSSLRNCVHILRAKYSQRIIFIQEEFLM